MLIAVNRRQIADVSVYVYKQAAEPPIDNRRRCRQGVHHSTSMVQTGAPRLLSTIIYINIYFFIYINYLIGRIIVDNKVYGLTAVITGNSSHA